VTGSSAKTPSIDQVLSRSSHVSCVSRSRDKSSSLISIICLGRPAMPPLMWLVETSTHSPSRSLTGPPGPSRYPLVGIVRSWPQCPSIVEPLSLNASRTQHFSCDLTVHSGDQYDAA